ncbi:hypothetical protein SmaMPs15_000037 [Stenotrophomonas maltophilia phage vB_SmaM_Ps15]|uniref:Uncharacterized protein n=1 Tax=Stenotrophomonas maltophilia phage vB_SmaM_Ps15 TaxID=3071007 RepID=A0AAE9FP33_9CAUD|nr:hypothetical protein PQC01_gp037 [Stenotrophomonas maltophilia phage vB_SmaM_Ps15]UMO77188.1 hypothetical protein SmaMPs15_000037 [Stenotrophomonas maltophilia phage vB_SmaM_Ps15]
MYVKEIANMKKQKTTAWFGYGTQEKYHAAKPYVAIFKSLQPCKFKNRHHCGAFRFETEEARAGFIERNGGVLLATRYCPTSRGFEGIAEEAYPHYVID